MQMRRAFPYVSAALLMAAPLVASTRARVIQTNSAGDNVHIIDPATNKVAGVIEGIDVPHGVTIAPDGSRIYITEEPTKTMDVVDPKSLQIIRKIPLSGRPNNLAVSKDGRKVYVAISQAPGAVDVIDTASLTNIRTVPVDGAVHNVYVTPDGRYAVSGSIARSTISVIDTETDKVAWSVKLSSGIRPMAFIRNPNGSTKEIIVQLSDFHGLVIVDFQTHQEVKRITLPDVPGKERETDGIQGSPAHGLVITPDGKTLWTTSKYYDYVAAYSLPDFKLLKVVPVGLHPEWLTIPPDGKNLYVACAGKDETVVVNTRSMEVIATIPVGAVPKRNASGMLQTTD